MKQILLMMLGHPGTGKSHFTRQLAPRIKAVRYNADNMRSSMFQNTPEQITNRANNPVVFAALDYAVYSTLQAGISVIYDVQHNKIAQRAKGREMAAEFGATAVLVWVQAPYDVALKRGQSRAESGDTRRKTEEHMRSSIDRFIAALEQPEGGEKCIIIDGTMPFEDQYRSFLQQLGE